MTKMEKILAIVLMFVTILLVSFNYAYVGAVDLNLTENTSSSSSNSADEDDTQNSEDTPTSNYARSSTSSNTKSSLDTSATVKTTSSTETGLGLSSILNIFLICIGILLIFLAIAILIRLKN